MNSLFTLVLLAVESDLALHSKRDLRKASTGLQPTKWLKINYKQYVSLSGTVGLYFSNTEYSPGR